MGKVCDGVSRSRVLLRRRYLVEFIDYEASMAPARKGVLTTVNFCAGVRSGADLYVAGWRGKQPRN